MVTGKRQSNSPVNIKGLAAKVFCILSFIPSTPYVDRTAHGTSVPAAMSFAAWPDGRKRPYHADRLALKKARKTPRAAKTVMRAMNGRIAEPAKPSEKKRDEARETPK